MISNNTFLADVARVVHHRAGLQCLARRHRTPNRFLLRPRVEAYLVLVHILDVGRVQVAAHQLVDAGLGHVRILPWTVGRRGLLIRSLVLEVSITSVLAGVGLESAMLLDGVLEWFSGVKGLVVKVLLSHAVKILLAFVRVDSVADLIERRKRLVRFAVVKPGHGLVLNLGGWALNVILPHRRNWVGLLTSRNERLLARCRLTQESVALKLNACFILGID
jgi:hypothetical protein